MKNDRIIVRVDSSRKQFIKDYAQAKDLTVSKIFRDWIDWLQKRTLQDEYRDTQEVRSNREDTDTQTNSPGAFRSNADCIEEEALAPKDCLH